MATTTKQDRDFIDNVVPALLLESAIEWIRLNMSPEDVFSESDLEEWALDNDFTRN